MSRSIRPPADTLTRAEAGFPLPHSPDQLIRAARMLDAFWREIDPDGSLKPTLEQELRLWGDR